MATQWEYKTLAFKAGAWTEIEPMLNELGQEGWEALTLSFAGLGATVLLKRPREVGAPPVLSPSE